MTTQTRIIEEGHGVKTIVTTLANGKRVYRTALPWAKNAGNPGTPFRRRELDGPLTTNQMVDLFRSVLDGRA